jgi:hypothetical protein
MFALPANGRKLAHWLRYDVAVAVVVETTLATACVIVAVTRFVKVMALEASAASVCRMVCTMLVVVVTKFIAVTTT